MTSNGSGSLSPPAEYQQLDGFLIAALQGCTIYWTEEQTVLVGRDDDGEGAGAWVEIAAHDHDWQIFLFAPDDMVGEYPLARDLAVDPAQLVNNVRVLLFEPLVD